jgi:ribosomal protein S18 acetylase RimI-like enzyme
MKPEIRVSEMASIARDSGVFRPEEIKILTELLESYFSGKDDYLVLNEKSGNVLAGFAIIGKTPCSVNAWDVYWLVTAKAHYGKGIARKLMKDIEDHILGLQRSAVLRVETSSRDDYSRARTFYQKQGFILSGTIKDFYDRNDDLVTYSKKITGSAPPC